MSRTVALYAPSRTRAGTVFGLLNPRNIQRAVNAGQQAANLARNIYQGISSTLRSPRISAGSIRNNQDMPRSSRNSNRRSFRSARPRVRRRRFRRNRRSLVKNPLLRKIKQKSRGIRKLMSLAKGDNPMYIYDYVQVGTIAGSYSQANRIRVNAKLTEFKQINGYMSTGQTQVEFSPYYREFKPLKIWIKVIPKRAHQMVNGNVDKVPEVVDKQIPYLTMWPLQHSREDTGDTVQTALPTYNIKRAQGVKYVSFNKKTGTIMRHAPFFEVTNTINSDGASVATYTPLVNVPWLEAGTFNKIAVGSCDIQLPQFYSADAAAEKRETPKYEVEVHIIGKYRLRSNNIMEY